MLHCLYADMLCSAYFLFSFVITAEIAVQSCLTMSAIFIYSVIKVVQFFQGIPTLLFFSSNVVPNIHVFHHCALVFWAVIKESI